MILTQELQLNPWIAGNMRPENIVAWNQIGETITFRTDPSAYIGSFCVLNLSNLRVGTWSYVSSTIARAVCNKLLSNFHYKYSNRSSPLYSCLWVNCTRSDHHLLPLGSTEIPRLLPSLIMSIACHELFIITHRHRIQIGGQSWRETRYRSVFIFFPVKRALYSRYLYFLPLALLWLGVRLDRVGNKCKPRSRPPDLFLWGQCRKLSWNLGIGHGNRNPVEIA